MTAWENAGRSEAYSLWADVAVGCWSGRDEVAAGQAGILRLVQGNKEDSWCGMPTNNNECRGQGNVSHSPFPQAHRTHASILWVPVVMWVTLMSQLPAVAASCCYEERDMWVHRLCTGSPV